MRALLTISLSLFSLLAFTQKTFIADEEKRDYPYYFTGETKIWTITDSEIDFFYQLEAIVEETKITVKKRDITAELFTEATIELAYEGIEVRLVEVIEVKGQVYALGFYYEKRDRSTRHLVRLQLNLKNASVVDATELTITEKQKSPLFINDWRVSYSPDSSRILLHHQYAYPDLVRGVRGNTYRSTLIILDESLNVLKKILPDEVEGYGFLLMEEVSINNSGDIYMSCMLSRPEEDRVTKWDKYISKIALLSYDAIPGKIAFLDLDTDARRVMSFPRLNHTKDGHLLITATYQNVNDDPNIIRGILVVKLVEELRIQTQFEYPVTAQELVNDGNTNLLKRHRLTDRYNTRIELELIDELVDELLFKINVIGSRSETSTTENHEKESSSSISVNEEYEIDGISILLKFSITGELIWHTNIDKYTTWVKRTHQPSLFLPLKDRLYIVYYNELARSRSELPVKDVFFTTLDTTNGKIVEGPVSLIEEEKMARSTLQIRNIHQLNDSTFFMIAEGIKRWFYPVVLQLE